MKQDLIEMLKWLLLLLKCLGIVFNICVIVFIIGFLICLYV